MTPPPTRAASSNTATRAGATIDAISLQVLRTQLEAISDESADTIERTAISPVVTESKDYSSTLLDADGRLVVGGGRIEYHFGASSHAVRSTMALHGDTVAPGDVFLGNDPHNGGGLHAQDVMVQQPVFADGELIAWVVNSAHLIDLGGMALGSWAPAATECYQEAIRFPPVRLFRAGREEADVWAILRNNVRMSMLVEMDMRGLVAGCHVAESKLVQLATSMGIEAFRLGVDQLQELSAIELRRRITELEDGTYTVVSWAEWGDEFFRVPCTLTVDGERLVFDFEGAAPQSTHFFNSKPYIIESELVADVCAVLAQDLPFSYGMFAPFELRCPEGTIVNSQPPAPVASSHMDVAFCASMAGVQCVLLAIAASPGCRAQRYLSGPCANAALATHTWSYLTAEGYVDGWAMLDGCLPGASAGWDRDGLDCFSMLVGRQGIIEIADIEALESWYPILVRERRSRPGAFGAGEFRSGAGCQMSYRPHGVAAISGVMLGMRERLPLPGLAGGFPGATTAFRIHRADGRIDPVPGHDMGVAINPSDTFEFLCASGGGYGDPLMRDPARVARDVELGRLAAEDASDAYGVVMAGAQVDEPATLAARDAIRTVRLARARPAEQPLADDHPVPAVDGVPLYPGVEQRGDVAVSAVSGAPLAVAPHHWTDGCPMDEQRVDGVVSRAFLDPRTGGTLAVDVVPDGEARSFASRPDRWTHAG